MRGEAVVTWTCDGCGATEDTTSISRPSDWRSYLRIQFLPRSNVDPREYHDVCPGCAALLDGVWLSLVAHSPGDGALALGHIKETPDGRWHHVVESHDADGVVRVYVDGVEVNDKLETGLDAR